MVTSVASWFDFGSFCCSLVSLLPLWLFLNDWDRCSQSPAAFLEMLLEVLLEVLLTTEEAFFDIPFLSFGRSDRRKSTSSIKNRNPTTKTTKTKDTIFPLGQWILVHRSGSNAIWKCSSVVVLAGCWWSPSQSTKGGSSTPWLGTNERLGCVRG